MNNGRAKEMRRVLWSLVDSEKHLVLNERKPENVKRHLMRDRELRFELARLGFHISTSLAYHRKQLGIPNVTTRWNEYKTLIEAKRERTKDNGKNKKTVQDAQ